MSEDNERRIWEYFWERLGNPYGVAGLVGNLYAESTLRPDNLQNAYERTLGMTDQQYARAVDSGTYADFATDRAGWGIAQWTHPDRKQALLAYARARGASIGDLGMQMDFLWHELAESYVSVLRILLSAQSVREASDAVLLKYERPADISVTNQERRAKLGVMFFERYARMPSRLIIYKRIFYDSDCYKSGAAMTPSGVQVHSTGANNPWLKRYVQPDDGRLGVNPNGNSHNQSGGDVCAHAYIGKQSDGTVAVYQALPWDIRCWLSDSGSNGNANQLGFLGFEICEDGLDDRNYFDQAMEQAILLTAYWCQTFGLDPDGAVRDHSELHGMGLASNHRDIGHWLVHFGKSMDDFRAGVKNAMAMGVEASVIDCDEVTPLYDAVAVNPGRYLNLRSGPGSTYKSIAQIPTGGTVHVLDDTDPAWWRVKYQDKTGYAMAEYLERVPDSGPPEEDPAEDEPVPVLSDTVPLTLGTAMQLYKELKNYFGE